MTVYVDDMQAEFKPSHAGARGRTYVMSHMIADTEQELHAMAAAIGLARKWYQGDHYDIAKSKRALAIKLGARAITMRQLGCMANNRRCGWPTGTPETAEAITHDRFAERGGRPIEW
ncbi:MAG: DUF4031 domain-containing protein [Xanthobacteraceae bacterium]